MITLAQADLSAVEEFGRTVARVLPQVVLFLLILIVGYLIARAIGRIVDRVLGRVGFDRAVERGGVGRTLARAKYDPSDILGKVVFYGLMLFVLQLAFGVFGDNPISELIRGVIAYLPNLVVAIVIVVIAAAIAAAVKEIVEASLGGLSYGRALAVAASVAILVVGGFAALDQLQVAPDIVNTLFIGLVAVVAGSAVVAIGGGGVMPMRRVWERALNRAEEEAPRVREEARGAGERVRERAEERVDQARQTGTADGAASSSTTLSGVHDETMPTRPALDPDPGQRPPDVVEERPRDVVEERPRDVVEEPPRDFVEEPPRDTRDTYDSTQRLDTADGPAADPDLTQPMRQPRYDDEPPQR